MTDISSNYGIGPGFGKEKAVFKTQYMAQAGNVKQYPPFDESIFDDCDESQCQAPRTAKDLADGGIEFKTLIEHFAEENTQNGKIIYGKSPEYNIKYGVTELGGGNYVFEVVYNTPTRKLIVKYNSKEKLTYTEYWLRKESEKEKVLDNAVNSKFNARENAFEQTFVCPINDGAKGVMKQKIYRSDKSKNFSFDAALYNPSQKPLLRIYRDTDGKKYRYDEFTIYPKSPDSSKRLEYTMVMSGLANNRTTKINEVRIKDKNGKEWIISGKSPSYPEGVEKYFKRKGKFQEIETSGATISAPYLNREIDDDLLKECFGCNNSEEFLKWAATLAIFFKQKIIPALQEEIVFIPDFYPIVKDYSYDKFKCKFPNEEVFSSIESFQNIFG